MTPPEDPVTAPNARLDEMRRRNEDYITAMAFTEATVANSPHGDLRLCLAALEAVLEEADEWAAVAAKADSEDVTGQLALAVQSAQVFAYRDCAKALREVITRELAGSGHSQERGDEKETGDG